jgi:hypothetical protein
MSFSVLMFADHAVLANGLLYVNGGGVNLFERTAFPTPLNAYLVGVLDLPPEHNGSRVPLSFIIERTENGEVIAQFDAEMGVTLKENAPVRNFGSPFVIDMRAVPIPVAGSYRLVGLVGEHSLRINFSVLGKSET